MSFADSGTKERLRSIFAQMIKSKAQFTLVTLKALLTVKAPAVATVLTYLSNCDKYNFSVCYHISNI
jgi:hypothetical protein